MKKIVVLLIITCITVLVFSSCNKKDCPAYSRAITEQTNKNI